MTDIINFKDQKEARQFIKGFIERFRKSNKRRIDYVKLDTGRTVFFDTMSNDDALIIAQDLRRMEIEAGIK